MQGVSFEETRYPGVPLASGSFAEGHLLTAFRQHWPLHENIHHTALRQFHGAGTRKMDVGQVFVML